RVQLVPVPLERVTTDEEAEDLLLAREPLGLGPARYVRQRRHRPLGRGRTVAEVEERRLSGLTLGLAELRLAQHDVEGGEELGAVPELVARTGQDERLERAPPDDAQVHAL